MFRVVSKLAVKAIVIVPNRANLRAEDAPGGAGFRGWVSTAWPGVRRLSRDSRTGRRRRLRGRGCAAARGMRASGALRGYERMGTLVAFGN